MAMKLPEQSGREKVSSVLQLVCFVVIFVLIYLLLKRFATHIILWALLLVADYIVTSLIVFLVIRPLFSGSGKNKRKPKC